MKRILATMMVLSTAHSAMAQTSSTSAPAPAAAAATTTTQTATVAPAAAKAWSTVFVMEVNAGAQELNEKGSDAKIVSGNLLGVSYQYSEKVKLSFGHNFELNSVPNSAERATNSAERTVAGKSPNGYASLDPYLGLSQKMAGVLGSDGFSILHRWYLPVMPMNWEGVNAADRRLGLYRLTTEIPYTLSPSWSVSYVLDPRFRVKEFQSFLDFRNYGTVYYNFNDKVQVYGQAGLKTVKGGTTLAGESAEAQLISGRNSGQRATGEYGLNWTATKQISMTTYYTTDWVVDGGIAGKPFEQENSTFGLVGVISL